MGLVSHRSASRVSHRIASLLSVKRAWDWSTVAACFPHGPEIAVRVAGDILQYKIALVAMLTFCLIIRKGAFKKSENVSQQLPSSH